MITAEVRQARGERDHAARAWDSLRVIVEELLQHRPDDALFRALLGLAYAGLGRRDEAVRQAERAVELLPVARDALDGPDYVYLLAEVLIMVGEHDRAIERLEYLLGIPITLTRAMLRADPLYAPLRGNPRFERLVAGN
jgi:serine/threonine-protein kinase